jgi:hypothetical protein
MGKKRRTHNCIRNFVTSSSTIHLNDLITFVLNEIFSKLFQVSFEFVVNEESMVVEIRNNHVFGVTSHVHHLNGRYSNVRDY